MRKEYVIKLSGYIIADGLPISLIGPFVSPELAFAWWANVPKQTKDDLDKTGGDAELTVMFVPE